MRIKALFLSALLLSGCSYTVSHTQLKKFEKEYQKYKELYAIKQTPAPKPQTPKPLKEPQKKEKPEFLQKRLSVNFKHVPFTQAVQTLTFLTKTNILVDRDPKVFVDLFLIDATLEQALEALCNRYGFEYSVKEEMVEITTYKTAIFKLFVPASLRQISSSVTSAAATGGDNQSGDAQLSIVNQLKIDMWEQITTTLEQIISDEEKTAVQVAYTQTEVENKTLTDSNQDSSQGSVQNQKSFSQARADQTGEASAEQNSSGYAKQEGNPLKKASKDVDLDKIFPKKQQVKANRYATTQNSAEAFNDSQTAASTQNRNFQQNIQQQRQKSVATAKQTSISRSVEYRPFIQVDRLSGVVVAKARPKTLQKIGEYIQTINHILNKEIMIDLEIVEFINTHNFNMGVDWKKLIDDVNLLGVRGT
ncbi:MAG: hypothetical protein GXO16_03260, partial [Epsilonproteobacteria bacterium]|nr:hypothetical protein [Campylobacterota bacterium]